MNYISRKLREYINICEGQNNIKDYSQYLHVYVQYNILLCLGTLYNIYKKSDLKNFNENQIILPTLGALVNCCKQLNNQLKVFPLWEKQERIFSDYIKFRNDWSGHGFEFSYDNQMQIEKLTGFYKDLEKGDLFISESFNIVKVKSISETHYSGINYTYDGKLVPWKCKKNEHLIFESDTVYLQTQNIATKIAPGIMGGLIKYYKISPFIDIDDKGFWSFQNIQEPLIGRIIYNNMFGTDKKTEIYNQFEKIGLLETEEFQIREASKVNRTIRNKYENVYEKYISLNSDTNQDPFIIEIKKFLKNSSTTLATIWGHGGVGKTASLQKLCDDLFFQEKKILTRENLYFDYIIFLSAKDRKYNYYTGQIEEIKGDRLTTYEDLIKSINELIFNDSNTSSDKIIKDFVGRMLLVIDDFETLKGEERKSIINFLEQLNVIHHRVIVTTRIATGFGKEIERKELDIDSTSKFLIEILKEHFGERKQFGNLIDQLEGPEISRKIHDITSGRPVFIFHFAHLLEQNQNLEQIIKIDIKNNSEALEFLYGRFYDYLDDNTRIVFKSLPLIINKTDLSCRLSNLKYIIDLNESQFNRSIRILEKLRIISLTENRDFLSIYTKEILQIMEKKIHEDDQLRNQINNKLQNENLILKGSNKTVFEQILNNLTTQMKLNIKVTDIVDGFERLIKDSDFSLEERVTAFTLLIDFLACRKSRNDLAIDLCNEYSLYFKDDSRYTWAYFNVLKRAGDLVTAITMAETYLDSANNSNELPSIYFSISGEYLKISCKSLNAQKDDLNRTRQDLTDDEYHNMAQGIRKDMTSLEKTAKNIFNNLKQFDYFNLPKVDKFHISNGIICFLKMYRRILTKHNKINQEKYQFFTEVIKYGINNFPGNERDELITLQYNVDQNDIKSAISGTANSDKKGLSDFAEKLKETLGQNKEFEF